MNTNSTPKLENRGEVYMFVEYVEIHNDRVYGMRNETTNVIHVLRDVVWLKQIFFAKKEVEE